MNTLKKRQRYVKELHQRLVQDASKRLASLSKGRNNPRKIRKRSRFPVKHGKVPSTQSPIAVFSPLTPVV